MSTVTRWMTKRLLSEAERPSSCTGKVRWAGFLRRWLNKRGKGEYKTAERISQGHLKFRRNFLQLTGGLKMKGYLTTITLINYSKILPQRSDGLAMQ